MGASPELEKLRQRLTLKPDDDEVRARLSKALLARGERREAAEILWIAAKAAWQAGDADRCRTLVQQCLQADDLYPALFLDRDGAAVPAAPDPALVLVVHPIEEIRRSLAHSLGASGHDVAEAAGAAEAHDVLDRQVPDLVVVPGALPDGGVIGVVGRARERNPRLAVLLLSCRAADERIAEPDRLFPVVDEHLERPLSSERFHRALEAALWRQRRAPRMDPLPTRAATGPWGQAAVTRAALIVLAGYLVILSLHEGLLALKPAAPPPDLPRVLPTAFPVPAELSLEEEAALERSLTTTARFQGAAIRVIDLTRELLGARAYRELRASGQVGAIPRAGIAEALSAYDFDHQRVIAIHVRLDEPATDPDTVARSLRIESQGAFVSPRRVTRLEPGRADELAWEVVWPKAAIDSRAPWSLSLEVSARPLRVTIPGTGSNVAGGGP